MAESLLAGDSLNDGGGGAAAAKGGAGAARITPSLAVCALLGSAGAAQYGLAVGVVNAPQASIKADLALSTLQISLVVSAFAVAGWAGATIAPRFVDSWGRRPFLIALQCEHRARARARARRPPLPRAPSSLRPAASPSPRLTSPHLHPARAAQGSSCSAAGCARRWPSSRTRRRSAAWPSAC
jgi:hypothetical protein